MPVLFYAQRIPVSLFPLG